MPFTGRTEILATCQTQLYLRADLRALSDLCACVCVNGWIRGFGVFLHTDCDECSELWTPGLYCHWISLKHVPDNSIKINF